MKKILIFSLAYYPHVGGAEVAMKEITDRLPYIEWHMLTLNFGGEKETEQVGNIIVHRIGNGYSYLSKILFIPRAALAARAINRTVHFDALWAMMSYMIFPIVLARLSVPYVLTLQEGDPWSHMFGRWFILPVRPLLSWGFRHAARITAISTYLTAWARSMGYRGVIELVPNGADLKLFQYSDHRTVSTTAPVLVTTSRLVHKNGVDTVIRALPHLPEARFVICGGGEEESHLRSLAKRVGVEDRVEFRLHVDQHGLLRALSEADIFIRPSRTEGMGNSFIEAMAAGLPVIGTQVGGIRDFLFDAQRNPDKESTGWAVDPDAPDQIVSAVRTIQRDPYQARATSKRARAIVEERYSWDTIAPTMSAVFESLS